MITKNEPFGNKIIFFFLSILMMILFIAIFINYIDHKTKEFENKIFPNVYIDNTSFEGSTINDINNYFQNKNNLLSALNITIMFGAAPIATYSGQQLHLVYNGKSMSERAYLIGRSSHLSSQIIQKIRSFFNLQKFTFNSSIEYDKSIIKDFINSSEDSYNKPAKNALFKFENNRVVNFKQEEKGLIILSDKLLNNIDIRIQQLKNQIQNITLVLESQPIIPEITLAKANSFGIEELIGEGKSNYTHSAPERIHNLTLATTKFNGVLIPKDKIISFSDIVGDISSSTGYVPGYIIKDGKTILGDGGGVCQVSTTLFRAALNTGLPIIERHPHAYRVLYYENDSLPGFDATIFAPTVDLKIKNDTPAYILIQTSIDTENKIVTFKLYGKKDKRKVEISPATVYDVQSPPPALYQDDPTQKKGTVKQIDFPAWGAKSVFTYKVTSKNNDTNEVKFYSVYKPWRAIYLQGTAD
ncbi:MAG: VanW family protein [bacterium]|nr:VanW family protein [bacterium]